MTGGLRSGVALGRVVRSVVAAVPGRVDPQSCPALPAVVAHRGGRERSLENTLGSFGSAGAAGILTWELEVHFDVSGLPVVLHDDTVDRVSPKSGPIADPDAADHAIPSGDGQWIPTLREVYDLAKEYGRAS